MQLVYLTNNTGCISQIPLPQCMAWQRRVYFFERLRRQCTHCGRRSLLDTVCRHSMLGNLRRAVLWVEGLHTVSYRHRHYS